MGLWKFLQYHNAVPIAFSIALLGAGGVFAASNPESIYNASEQVLSVDNSYIAYKDISSYTPTISITGVTEDEKYYYVAYSFSTIDVWEYVWQDVIKKEVMRVSKADLGPYRDLGLYVTEQLKQKIDREVAFLREVQDIEKKQLSQKMVATAYSGLIGQFLDDTTEALPNYTPVVIPPAPAPEPEPVAPTPVVALGETTPSVPIQPENTTPVSPQPDTSTPTGPTPILSILGESVVNLLIGDTYTDLGAVITGPTDAERALTIHVFVNDADVQRVDIDTSTAKEWRVSYRVFHQGVITTAERIITVSEPVPVIPPAEVPVEETPEESAPIETPPAETPTEPAPETPQE